MSMHAYEILAHIDPEASQCGSGDFLTFTQAFVSAQH